MLGWMLVGAGAFVLIFLALAGWALAAAAKLGDEIEQMRRLAELGRPTYRPVSDRHTRDFTQENER